MKSFLTIVIILMMSACASDNTEPPNISKNMSSSEAKVWPRETIAILRSHYLDENGLPSREIFLRKHGLFPNDQQIELTPYFRASYAKNDVEKTCAESFDSAQDKPCGELVPIASAEPLNLDFYVELVEKFRCDAIAEPIWDGRVYEENGKLVVGGYSDRFCEKAIGEIDNSGQFVPIPRSSAHGSDLPIDQFLLLRIPPSEIIFDPFEWRLSQLRSSRGKRSINRKRDFLPISIYDDNRIPIENLRFELQSEKSSLILRSENNGLELAKCETTSDAIVDKFDGYRPNLIDGCTQLGDGETITFTFRGEFSNHVQSENGFVQISYSELPTTQTQKIKVDGRFDDWRNVDGVSDPEGDYVDYLYPNPDTDLLEFKVANDQKYLYFYSRVVGAHGRTGADGRYYWYAYIDADHNPHTGYPPTRDDNCYFGVAIGDDCEAQFEFVANRFVKTFFGFTGLGSEKEVLDGRLKLGSSFYSSKNEQGQKRDRYKVEYVNRGNGRSITHDFTEGTSEDIVMALSADGSEIEMRVELEGFLWDGSGKPLLQIGKKIDLAIGAEASSDFYGSSKWGADSSPTIYGYRIE